ncbi:MAG: FAD-dependent oxidoreductase [Burkholderiales bacterium]|nr:FAD-dependent oxidoreductase [Burkholderiales bacterium]
MNAPDSLHAAPTARQDARPRASAVHVGIAGAGVLGRLLAWQLAHRGCRVEVFDPATGPQPAHDGRGAAGFTAAGMLSPLAEFESGGIEVAVLGLRSIESWRGITAALAGRTDAAGGTCASAAAAAATDSPSTDSASTISGAADPAAADEPEPLFCQRGSLMVAHPGDLGAAQRVLARLEQAPALHAGMPAPQPLDRAALSALEPAVAPGMHAWLLPGEAQVLPAPLLAALAHDAPGVHWHWRQRARSVSPGCIETMDGARHRFDLAIDVRGLGARPELPVRGVRGEVIWLHAPGVPLARPLRLLHPRHRVYLVPRPGDLVVVGASEIESEDRSPVSLRTALELMAAAHSAVPELAEARIVHLETNLRPALPDNQPLTQHEPGLARINGLFRHGWLLAPALVEDLIASCLPVH